MRRAGMETKVYIDTNIFVYAVIHHPRYGDACSRILRDMGRRFEAHGSHMVALELLGSLAKIDPGIARRAVKLYLALDMLIHGIDEEILHMASLINETINIGHDSIHAAIMIANEIPAIITNDLDDWRKLASKYRRVREALEKEGYTVDLEDIEIVSPGNYDDWAGRL